MPPTSAVDALAVVFQALPPEEQEEALDRLRELQLDAQASDESQTGRMIRSLRRVAEVLDYPPSVDEYKRVSTELIEAGEDVETLSRLYSHFGSWPRAHEALLLSETNSAKLIDARFRRRRVGKVWHPDGRDYTPELRRPRLPRAARHFDFITAAQARPATGSSTATEARRSSASAGAPGPALATWLTDQGVPTATGGVWWSPTTVQSLLGRRVYLGESRRLDVVNREAHEPLVDAAAWQAAQRHHAAKVSTRRPMLLAGLLRCSGCSRVLGGRNDPRGRVHYNCPRNSAAGRCPAPVSIHGSVAEPYAEAVLWGLLASPGRRRQRTALTRAKEETGSCHRADGGLPRPHLPAANARGGAVRGRT